MAPAPGPDNLTEVASLRASSRLARVQPTCPIAKELITRQGPARKSPVAPITASTKQQLISSPGLKIIRSQRNRVLLERVANKSEARVSVASSQLSRRSFANAAQTPVAGIDIRLVSDLRQGSSARLSCALAKENTNQTAPMARLSKAGSRREVRAQTQAAPAAIVTNCRLREGALYARRHQFRLSPVTSPQPMSSQALDRNRRELISSHKLPAVEHQRSQPKGTISPAHLLLPRRGKHQKSVLEQLPASPEDSGSRRSESSSRRPARVRHTKTLPPTHQAPQSALVACASETEEPKTNSNGPEQANQDNISATENHQEPFFIDQNFKLNLDREDQGKSTPEEAVAKGLSERQEEETLGEQENKIDISNYQISVGEKMRLNNSETASLILQTNIMQRSRSSLGSSRNSIESSSSGEQMVLGSPLVSPAPSETGDISAVDNQLEASPFRSSSANKDTDAKSPIDGVKQQSKKQKKCIVDIPIRKDSITDFYELESRPFARGKFAQVKRCVNKATGQFFAAKCIKKRRRLVDIKHEILLEIEALKLSYHTDRIVKLYEIFETTNEIILILEMANGGELQRVLDDEELISENIVKKMVRQILEALMELHENDIAHLDIKPQNLLLTEPFPDGDIKLCDFGISRRITKDCEIREICGTPDYVAPEILRYDPISLATDMWSLGVLIYVLLSGYSPFGSDNKQQTFCNITQATLDFPSELFDKNEISQDAIDFIGKLIVRDPDERLTSKQARNHSWLSND